ncbi:MAG: MFS transporter [Parvibaculaceae bacterium]|nr:MFS transporter [Parvibaculaceae bacterium]
MTSSSASNRFPPFFYYMLTQSSWFLSMGIQFILFPYLVTEVLQESGTRVGIAQMSLQIPSLLFMLLGGTIAERRDVRSILMVVHGLAIVPPLALFFLMQSGGLEYGFMITYGLAMGTLSAFAMPARDTLLSKVVPNGDIQKGVMLAMMAQQMSMLTGMILAISGNFFEASLLFILQTVIIIIGGIGGWKLPPMPALAHHKEQGRIDAIIDGVREVFASATIKPVVILMFFVGMFYVGAFMVVLPLMIRDIYQGSITEFAIAFSCFWGATILSTVILMRFAPIARPGRLLGMGTCSGVIFLTLFHFEMSFVTYCGLSFMWGLGAGVTMALTRMIVQMEAPDSHRARILSVYQLGFAGGAPMGSLAMGFLVDTFGLYDAVLFPAGSMVLVLLYLFTRTQLIHVKAPGVEIKGS